MKVTHFIKEINEKRGVIAARITHEELRAALIDLDLPAGWLRIQHESSTIFRHRDHNLPAIKVFHGIDAVVLRFDVDQVDKTTQTFIRKRVPDLITSLELRVLDLDISIGQAPANECANYCAYARDVAMPEYSCGNGCMYTLKDAPKQNDDNLTKD